MTAPVGLATAPVPTGSTGSATGSDPTDAAAFAGLLQGAVTARRGPGSDAEGRPEGDDVPGDPTEDAVAAAAAVAVGPPAWFLLALQPAAPPTATATVVVATPVVATSAEPVGAPAPGAGGVPAGPPPGVLPTGPDVVPAAAADPAPPAVGPGRPGPAPALPGAAPTTGAAVTAMPVVLADLARSPAVSGPGTAPDAVLPAPQDAARADTTAQLPGPAARTGTGARPAGGDPGAGTTTAPGAATVPTDAVGGDQTAPEPAAAPRTGAAAETGPDTGTPAGIAPPPPPGQPVTPATAAAAPGPVPTDPPVAAQLTPQLLALASSGGSHSVTMVLAPESLGEVLLQLTVTGDQVSLAMSAGQDGSRSVLADAIPELRRDLAAAGLTLTDAQVSTGAGGQAGSGWSQAGDQRTAPTTRWGQVPTGTATADEDSSTTSTSSTTRGGAASPGVDVRV